MQYNTNCSINGHDLAVYLADLCNEVFSLYAAKYLQKTVLFSFFVFGVASIFESMCLKKKMH